VKLCLRIGNVSPTIIYNQKMHLSIYNVMYSHPQSNVDNHKNKSKGKGKVHPKTGHKGPKESTRIAILFFNLGARQRWVVSATFRQYPLHRRQSGPQSRSGPVRKISPTPGLDPQTFQPVASRYTDWPTRYKCG